MNFAHIHVHSHFSIGDGISTPKEIVEAAVKLGHNAVALTDHGSACGLFEFWKECTTNKIKPICGVEAYLAQNVKIEDEETGKLKKDTTYHSVLIAKNEQGYKDLCKLLYKANKETYYYRPLILFEDLFSIEKGNIIATTACIGGILNRHFIVDKDEDAYKIALRFKEFFGDDFYTEIMLNELHVQHGCNEKVIKLAKDLSIKTIITNDVHYVTEDLVEAQDALKLIIRKKTMEDIEKDPEDSPFSNVRRNFLCNRKDFSDFNKDFSFNYEESFIDGCLENTNEIAEKCSFGYDIKTKRFPKVEIPKEYKDIKDYFIKLCYKGLDDLITSGKVAEAEKKKYSDRLDYEMKVIVDAGFCDYFIISKSIFDFCRERGVWSGAGRGSAAGSLVSYVLGITKMDPIKFNLMFERFLNPERAASVIPDIDSDFESDRKSEIEEFLKSKYGDDAVLHVATFNEFHMKGVIRDLVRVFNVNDEPLKIASKLFDEDLPPEYKTIREYLEKLSEKENTVFELINSPNGNKILKFADKLYKKLRFLGKHAAGIVVFDGSAGNYLPVVRSHGEILTGFSEGTDKKHLSELNILKLDILGLETMSIIKDTIELVKKHKNVDLTEKIYDIDMSDNKLYDTINDFENSGIFQMESGGINKLCKAVKPTSFEDISAISALFRPGALQGGNAFAFAEAKNDPLKKIEYPKILEKYVSNTYGVIVYQEQLIQCISDVLGIDYGKADKWRKIFANGFRDFWIDAVNFDDLENEKIARPKLKEFMDVFGEKIKKTHSELDEQQSYETLLYVLKASGYVFNRSHSSAYSYCTMQTLFLKTYYPLEFYASLIKRADDALKTKRYLTSAKRKGLKILPFSITKSKYGISIENDSLRVGFSMIKGFGDKAWTELEAHQSEIKDIQSFISIEWSKLNKTCIRALASIGAFDEFGHTRKNIVKFFDEFLENERRGKRTKLPLEQIMPLLTESTSEFSQKEISMLYKEFIEFDFNIITNSLFEKLTAFFEKNNIKKFMDVAETGIVGGVIEDIKQKKTKNNKNYYEITVNDCQSTEKVKLWPWAFPNDFNQNTLQENSIILVEVENDEKWGFSNRKWGIIKVL